MGFAYNTASITDADLFKYGFEQEITNILRESGKTDFSDLRKAAVNVLVRDLKLLGVAAADVSNTQDFEAELVYWCLQALYAGEEPDANGTQVKRDYYAKQHAVSVQSRVIELTDGTTLVPGGRTGVPAVGNQDAGAFFPTADNAGERIGYSKIDNYDTHIWDRPA